MKPPIALIAAALIACGQPEDEFEQAAHALFPACVGTRALFWIPAERCTAALHAWETGVKEFGPPSAVVSVVAVAGPWQGGDSSLAGKFNRASGRLTVAAHVPWCSSGLIHEMVHSTRLHVSNEDELHHVDWGDTLRPAPGTLYYRIREAQQRCKETSP